VASFVDELSVIVGLIVVDRPDDVVLSWRDEPSSDDNGLSAMFESSGLTQLVVEPITHGDNQLNVLATIDSTHVNNDQVDHYILISYQSLIIANLLVYRNATPR
jgi:hypothetical protein